MVLPLVDWWWWCCCLFLWQCMMVRWSTMQVAEVVAVAVAAVEDEDGAQWHGGGSVRQQHRWTMDRRCQGNDDN
jgi:hypothetical protein